MKDNIILDKSFNFAVRIVKPYKYFCNEKKESIAWYINDIKGNK